MSHDGLLYSQTYVNCSDLRYEFDHEKTLIAK